MNAALRPPRAVLFDLDDTLLDSATARASAAAACAWVAEELGGGVTGADLQRALGEVWRTYWPEIEQSTWRGRVEGYAVSREAWRRALAACGRDDPALAAEVSRRQHAAQQSAMRLFDDVDDLLGHLRDAGVRTALVTNGASDLQRDKIRVLGLDVALDAVVVSGEHGVAKPDAEVFVIALAALGVDAADAWHVGDNPATDVAGARNAGVAGVWLNRAGAAPAAGHAAPDLEVASLTALLAHLRVAAG